MNCWFCDVIEEDPKKSLHLKLYGEVDAKTKDSVTKVKYVLHKVDVPRCPLCKSKHMSAILAFLTGSLFLFVSLVLAVVSAFGILTGFFAGSVTGIFAGLAIGGFIFSKGIHKGIHSVLNAKKVYPEVKALLDKGYKFGKGIKDHTHEVRPTEEISDGSSQSDISQ